MAVGQDDWKIRNLERSWLDDFISNEITDGDMTVPVSWIFQGRMNRMMRSMSEREFRWVIVFKSGMYIRSGCPDCPLEVGFLLKFKIPSNFIPEYPLIILKQKMRSARRRMLEWLKFGCIKSVSIRFCFKSWKKFREVFWMLSNSLMTIIVDGDHPVDAYSVRGLTYTGRSAAPQSQQHYKLWWPPRRLPTTPSYATQRYAALNYKKLLDATLSCITLHYSTG